MDTAVPALLSNFQEFRRKWMVASKLKYNRTEIGKSIKAKIGGYMLRRIKENELKGLPNKKVKIVPEQMTEKQLKLYNIVLDIINENSKDLNNIDNKKKGWLKYLWKIRNISLHPRLIEDITPIPANEAVAFSWLNESAKTKWLIKKLNEIKINKNKVLIFCETKKFQTMLSLCLRQIYKINVPIINGDTKTNLKSKLNKTRLGIIKEFSESNDFSVLILSPIAAGVGLNITAANHVIHLERTWNPAKENQANDRAYRIGQKKNVFIWIPLSIHSDCKSFDEILNKLLVKKSEMFDSICGIDIQEKVQDSEFKDAFFSSKNKKTFNEDVSINYNDAKEIYGIDFEKLIFLIYQKSGAISVELTPNNDHGVDLIVIGANGKEGQNYFIQCKTKTKYNEAYNKPKDIREVVGGKPLWEKKLGLKATKLIFHTNCKNFSSTVKSEAKNSDVEILGFKWLKKMLSKYPVTMKELLTLTDYIC